MGQCNCYNVRIDRIYGNEVKYGVCLGTKDQDRCNCGGDESKCSFYEYKRKRAFEGDNEEIWKDVKGGMKVYIK